MILLLIKAQKYSRADSINCFHTPPIRGYEIHCGRMDKYPLYYRDGRVAGTHVHGVFDDDTFRGDYFKAINPAYRGYAYGDYRKKAIQNFADSVAGNLDMDAILQALQVD